MKISTKGRYALRIMVDLASCSNGEFISLSDISKRQGISNKYLEQIISLLNKAGYVETKKGYKGGYRLKKAAKEYKLGDILRVCEGDLMPISCLKNDSICERKKYCKTYSFWKGLDDVINEYVDNKTLQDLIK